MYFVYFDGKKQLLSFLVLQKKTTFENCVKTKQREDNQDNSHLF
jgi:hypothetical protein